MSACFGIHLGNNSACIALSKDGKTEVIANDLGDRVTPALLAFNGSEFEICASAKSGSRRKAIIKDNKRIFNDAAPPSASEIEELNAKNDCKLAVYENAITYELQAENNLISLTPDQIATKFFERMFSIAAHAACSEDELQTVIAVPHHWSAENRRRISTAAELAGFSVLQVINEPAAAALAYDVGESSKEECVLVYRLGGSSCDATLIRTAGGIYAVEASHNLFGIGGQFITRDLADYIAAEFFQKWKLDPQENKRAMEKLFHSANDCKHALSTLNSAHVFIESLYEGVDWSQNVSRARFENLITPKVESLTAPLREILSQTGLKDKVTKIILCGGSMKIPKLQSAISDMLPGSTLLNGISPDEVISIGCAKQAALLQEFPDVSLKDSSIVMDCIKFPIFAKYLDSNICLFPSGTPVLSEVEVPFARKDKSANIDLHIYRKDVSDVPLGDYSFDCGSANPKIHAILNKEELMIDVV